MMPLYAAATESLDLRGFDLVITSDSGPVKGVRMDPGAIQICYCYSPMRYLYDNYEEYRSHMGTLTRAAFTATAGRLRRWDLRAAQQVTHFIAISHYIAARIERYYHRPSEVIYPPVELSQARFAPPGDHYLCAGRMVGYKRTDLLIEACLRVNRKLRVVGGGPDEPALRRQAAAAPNGHLIEFLGGLPNDELWQQYATCRALLFAADEDFGIVPLEAQACGRPVLCYGVGGSLETVRGTGPEPTGLYFDRQTPESLMAAMQNFEADPARFDPDTSHTWAQSFDTPVFLSNMRRAILAHVPAAAEVMASA